MLISIYNQAGIGDVLLCITGQPVEQQASETQGDVTRIFDVQTQKTLGYNFQNASKLVGKIATSGALDLNVEQLNVLNTELKSHGFEAELVADLVPKFVVGYVEEMVEHPDSDHLHVTQTRVDQDQVLQIVCGAANIAQGQKVVVAKAGALMPNGLLIWPGALRGVESDGMICSARELGLPLNATNEKGILVLDEKTPTGTAFAIG